MKLSAGFNLKSLVALSPLVLAACGSNATDYKDYMAWPARTSGECSNAIGNLANCRTFSVLAFNMGKIVAPTFKSAADCEQNYKSCHADASGFRPELAGFSVITTRGETNSGGTWVTPLYRDSQDRLATPSGVAFDDGSVGSQINVDASTFAIPPTPAALSLADNSDELKAYAYGYKNATDCTQKGIFSSETCKQSDALAEVTARALQRNYQTMGECTYDYEYCDPAGKFFNPRKVGFIVRENDDRTTYVAPVYVDAQGAMVTLNGYDVTKAFTKVRHQEPIEAFAQEWQLNDWPDQDRNQYLPAASSDGTDDSSNGSADDSTRTYTSGFDPGQSNNVSPMPSPWNN